MSIRTRIALFGGMVTALTLLVLGVALYLLATRSAESERDRALANRSQDAVAVLATAPAEAFTPHQALSPVELRHDAGTGESFVNVVKTDGTTIVSGGTIDGTPVAIPADVLRGAATEPAFATIVLPPDVKVRLHITPWSRADLGLAGYVIAGEPTAQAAKELRGLGILILATSLVIALAAFVASWRVAGRALKPLHAMAGTVAGIGATGDLGQRLPEQQRADELGRLTTSFNEMLSRVEHSQTELTGALDAQRQFVADASHELRTPLTTIRANAGFLLARPDVRPDDRDAALGDIVAEGERMSRLVDDLLALARADAGQRPPRERLDVRRCAEEVVRQARQLHTTREIELEEPPDPLMVLANRDGLVRLLWILIDNAVKYTTRGGRIWVRLAADEARAWIGVQDDGVGIPEADLERVFERFYQADRARTGSGAGLGLAIARIIVAEHDGTIRCRNNPDRGAMFVVELPLASEPSEES